MTCVYGDVGRLDACDVVPVFRTSAIIVVLKEFNHV